jgi:phosphohistidine phosphatase
MKKRLLHLVRHAKSDWSIGGQSDFDRPLNARGIHDAPFMAELWFDFFPSPKTLHVSASKRTRETAELFVLGHADKILSIQFHQNLYHASEEHLMEFVQQIPAAEYEVAIISHNSGISDFASRLSGQSLVMPTCAIASFEVYSDWNIAAPHDFHLLHFDYPKRNR